MTTSTSCSTRRSRVTQHSQEQSRTAGHERRQRLLYGRCCRSFTAGDQRGGTAGQGEVWRRTWQSTEPRAWSAKPERILRVGSELPWSWRRRRHTDTDEAAHQRTSWTTGTAWTTRWRRNTGAARSSRQVSSLYCTSRPGRLYALVRLAGSVDFFALHWKQDRWVWQTWETNRAQIKDRYTSHVTWHTTYIVITPSVLCWSIVSKVSVTTATTRLSEFILESHLKFHE